MFAMLQPWQYIVLVGAVVIVAAFVMPKKNNRNDGEPQRVEDIEAAFGQFMESMEKDNEEIIALIAKAQTSAKREGLLQNERLEALEKRCGELESRLPSAEGQAASAPVQIAQPVAAIAPEDAAEAPADDTTIRGRYTELFGLHAQGKSIEFIAKKLGMNKGEVQLIIQLAKQEGALHG